MEKQLQQLHVKFGLYTNKTIFCILCIRMTWIIFYVRPRIWTFKQWSVTPWMRRNNNTNFLNDVLYAFAKLLHVKLLIILKYLTYEILEITYLLKDKLSTFFFNILHITIIICVVLRANVSQSIILLLLCSSHGPIFN